MLAYLTDVEGRWEKLTSFASDNPHVSLVDGALRLADGVTFVFGGDAIDRGPDSRRIVSLFLAAQREYGDRVILLAGNRDINKLRLVRELDGSPPERAPAGASGPELLRWIFTHTMGARDAFAHRAAELASEGRASDDDSVVQSFRDDVAPGGPLRRYIEACRIAYRSGTTLFLHGGITSQNAGLVPEEATRAPDVDAWVNGLNEFYATQLEGFAAGRSISPLLAYQGPNAGSRYNQQSVVYARLTDPHGNPRLPDAEALGWLRARGVDRLVVGHSPSGDCPAVLRDDDGFEVVFADNSYGRVERGSQLFLTDAETSIHAMSELDDGTRATVDFTADRSDLETPLGKRDRASGQLVKARLASGDYLLFRALPEYRVEQTAATPHDVGARDLVLARNPPPAI